MNSSVRNPKYNFELIPLITDFSFLDFIYEGIRYGSSDYGAFLIITNNQYVIGYNSSFGRGTHFSSFARSWADIHGIGDIQSDIEAIKISNVCENNSITARIVYEKYDVGYCGFIHFQVPNDGITYEQFEMFKQFYEDYNREICLVINKYGINGFQVSFTKFDNKRKSIKKVCGSLDEVLEWLKSKINTSKKVEMNDSEIIIGKAKNDELKK